MAVGKKTSLIPVLCVALGIVVGFGASKAIPDSEVVVSEPPLQSSVGSLQTGAIDPGMPYEKRLDAVRSIERDDLLSLSMLSLAVVTNTDSDARVREAALSAFVNKMSSLLKGTLTALERQSVGGSSESFLQEKEEVLEWLRRAQR